MTFPKVNPKQSFPKLEEEVIKYWKENNIFKASIETRKDCEEFKFYDGPPFATGTPHYGHLVGGTIKDVIPRYQTMKGKKVERNFGWDCHGLPIENIVEKKLEISGKDDIEGKIGVYDFNETCRANVFGYVDEWKKTVERMGRWVDMDSDYKTMDTDFMESVWWTYKTIYDKGLIYEGHRVVPYCPRCNTPLSNFEVNQGYKDKQSKTVTVKFKVAGSENKYILAWTTTPWTLYANLGLAVGEDITYVELLDKTNGDTYILAREKVKDYFNPGVKNKTPGLELEEETDSYKILREYKGACLVGIKYEPIFPDFEVQFNDMGKDLGTNICFGKNTYSVVLGHHVTTETGTGIVHIAPAYGEDDNIIGEKEDLGFFMHIDDSGKTYNLLDKNGLSISDINESVLLELKERKVALHIATINHSYPHCWRCDTPLIYRAISAWYVAVEKIREKMLANNAKIHWVPELIKEGRFGKWLEGARDWNISRNRYWGSAIPVWQSKDKKEEVCIGSIEELYQKNRDFGQITKVILVRHGKSEGNESGFIDGRRDDSCKNQVPLAKKGILQAEELKNILSQQKIDVIYSSPFDRTINTIKPLAEKLGVEIIEDFGLTEISFGELNRSKSSFWIEQEKYFFENPDEKIGKTGDSINSLGKRVQEFWEKIIINNNPGKTIVICSHYYPIQKILHTIKGLEVSEKTFLDTNLTLDNSDTNTLYSINYVYSNTGKEVDLHKHFVDEILIKGEEKSLEVKNVLGIHGWTSTGIKKGYNGKWLPLQDLLKENGINFDVPNFDSNKETSYAKWKEDLEKLEIKKYDTILATSFGCAVIMQYLCEKNIKIPRLVLVAPSGLKGNKYLEKIIPEMTENVEKLKLLIGEIIITHSKDDNSTSAPFSYGENLSKKLGCNFIPVNGIGHAFGGWNINLLHSLIKNGAPLQRIPEVLDCWFESGAMPYASKHYPFAFSKNGKLVTDNSFKFPADFIAEGLDQTRGWFYTLLILGTALFDNTPFLNCIVNGIVLAEDGKKMSKRLNNYPEPEKIFNKYGADAMRFYLMNSPVVEAQDLRFSESGVEEVVKKIILPLWNTYSFFTTYANIDKWSPEKGTIYYCRHGQTDNNKNDIMNGGDNDTPLNEKGIKQAHEVGKLFNLKNEKIDIIISSHLSRAYDTAKIIAEEIGYTGEIIQDKRLRDQDSGVLKGKGREELKKEFNLKNNTEFRKFFRDKNNNKIESVEEFEKRILEIFEEIQEKYKGKNILIVAHAGSIRPILKKLNNMSQDEAFYEMPSLENTKITKLPILGRKNILDKWIIGELHSLIKEVEQGMDNYTIAEATKPIIKFMDNLTNWYIRRSRKRFWKSENDNDKLQAYETLYEVLVTLCKVIAPFMPFVSEHIYRNLTNKKSIHLDSFPKSMNIFINEGINSQFEKTAHLVNLGLAWRQRNNLRVRQALSSATIGEKLEDYYCDIIKDELNVKELIILDNSDKIAKKICKPNARLIGPKFGQDVKFIMNEAKSGNFEELEDGKVKVANFILEKDEYEIAFEAGDSSFDIEAGFGMVIALDKNLTPELIQEGIARDIVRQIQEARKEASFEVSDRIQLCLKGENLEDVIKNFGEYIQAETLSSLVENIKNPDIEKNIELEERKIVIELKR